MARRLPTVVLPAPIMPTSTIGRPPSRAVSSVLDCCIAAPDRDTDFPVHAWFRLEAPARYKVKATARQTALGLNG